jgi:hypothetical protein
VRHLRGLVGELHEAEEFALSILDAGVGGRGEDQVFAARDIFRIAARIALRPVALRHVDDIHHTDRTGSQAHRGVCEAIEVGAVHPADGAGGHAAIRPAGAAGAARGLCNHILELRRGEFFRRLLRRGLGRERNMDERK